MATSQRRIDANRRNCLKSTGARTVNGRAVSRLNGLKHGLTAKTVVIPSEDPAEYHQLLADVSGTLVPRNRIETILTAQIAHASWMHDRVVRAQTARLTSAIEGADHLALEEVYNLGARLFHDRRVPAAISARSRGIMSGRGPPTREPRLTRTIPRGSCGSSPPPFTAAIGCSKSGRLCGRSSSKEGPGRATINSWQ